MEGKTVIQKFLSYVEIKTKITSVITFALALSYLFYVGQKISPGITLVFFVSMFLFDLTTTALNNYIDTKSNHQILRFKRTNALIVFFVLLILSIASGIYLVVLTDIIVLPLGILCFATGILYTFGPLPISRLPLGEIVSGIFYGFFIPFLIFYINMPEGSVMTLAYDGASNSISFSAMIKPLISIALLSVAPVCATANIMLANNICDLEKDVAVKRHTLPYYIGKKAVVLFEVLYYTTYAANIAMVVTGVLHPITLLALLTLPFVYKNIKKFKKVQDKATTFHVSIINFVLIMGANTFAVLLGALVKEMF